MDNSELKTQPPEEDNQQSLVQMCREIESCLTDQELVKQVESDEQQIKQLDIIDDQTFKIFYVRYQHFKATLSQNLVVETSEIKKAKDLANTFVNKSQELEGCNKGIAENENSIKFLKKEIEEKKEQTLEFEKKIVEKKEEIQIEKKKKEDLEATKEQKLNETELENERTLEDHKKQIDALNKQMENLVNLYREKREDNANSNKDVINEEKKCLELNKDVQDLKEKIEQIKDRKEKQEQRVKQMDRDMADINKKIDDQKKLQEQKNKTSEQITKDTKKISEQIIQLREQKESNRDQIVKINRENNQLKERIEHQKEQEKSATNTLDRQQKELINTKEQKDELFASKEKIMREQKIYAKKKILMEGEAKESKDQRDSQEGEEKILSEYLQKIQKISDDLKEDIEKQLKDRNINNKLLKKFEEDEHLMEEQCYSQRNKLKKVENQVLGFEAENEKLRKMITQLQKEQEKYGIEASQAHAKYYQTIEEVKIKNNQITELQKKNAEVEAKLKHQQNLYEAVRSDRNLYSKNLLESQEEISELNKKYTRMNHQVDQFKEEIKAKDAQLVKEDFAFNKILEENKKTIMENDRVEKAIASTDEVIKNQESHISRLKYLIQEAKAEKQRQEKDLEMVINERDILGTQLIKRNRELDILYEKIKLSESNLAKGETFYREKEAELTTLEKQLADLISELKDTKDQIACIDDLKNEINSLEKDILAEKTKVKALQDELENPLNVHRWRKLEATDQDNFERILKIQTLQRRLIAKTEEVEDKNNLIKEKEKLFMELKNILARQPGAEIHQQLASYKESLKDKTAQMKKMLAELKNSQETVDLLKFENNRLKERIFQMKQDYFKRRRQQDKQEEQSQANMIIQNPSMSQPTQQANEQVNMGIGGLQIGKQ